jgi:type II secretory pathway pseudopilin PulG
MTRARRAFSYVELLTVLAVMGILVRIAIPRFTDMKRRAIATEIVTDVHTIRLASYSYYTERSSWPPDYPPGVVPTELMRYLPQSFSFTRPDFEYDYELWPLSGGTPENPQQGSLLGLSVTTSDSLLADEVLRIAGRGYVPFASGNKVTFFLSGVTGN